MSLGAPDPSGGMGGGMPAMPGAAGGAGGGQGVQILQQIQDLFAQLAQAEPDPAVQRAVQTLSKPLDMLMQVVGGNDTQNMTSGLANPSGGSPSPEGSPAEEAGESPAVEASEGPPSKSFKGASKAAAAQKKKTGSYSKGSKG